MGVVVRLGGRRERDLGGEDVSGRGEKRRETTKPTKRRKLCDNLVDNFLELAVLNSAFAKFWWESEQKLGVRLGEVHRSA